MIFLPENPSTPFQFASNYIHMVGWGTVILAVIQVVWRARGVKEKFEEVHKQTTNHMPHSLDRIDRNIALLVQLRGGNPVLPDENEGQ